MANLATGQLRKTLATEVLEITIQLLTDEHQTRWDHLREKCSDSFGRRHAPRAEALAIGGG